VLHGAIVGLRALERTDVAVLHAELYEDVAIRSRTSSRAWRPISAESSASPFAESDSDSVDESAARFAVVDLVSGELAGAALLAGIDLHNRNARIGVSLFPAFRGRGMAIDVVRVLCEYGFIVRGLHRLQIETLADNVPMLRAAISAGFTQEGSLRDAAWVMGAFIDEVVLGLVVTDYQPPPQLRLGS
jgi:RimJ/RimL family protein N-acetyltransferase